MQRITTFLMFEGKAEEAMNFYMSLFPDASVTNIEKYGEGDPKPGTIKHSIFTLHGQEFMCIDSPIEHGFTFTPSISLWVACETEAEIDKLYAELSKDGQIMMPLNEYPFSKKFGWVCDRFGVSWQLSLTGR